MRRMPQDGRHLRPPAALHGVWPCGLLRLLEEQTRDKTLTPHQTPHHALHRTRPDLGVVLCGRVAAQLRLISVTLRGIVMDETDQNFGKPNPNAPAALSQFAFLIGRWRCDATITLANGESQKYEAAWGVRYILDGYVIAVEDGMASSAGETI